MILENVKKFFKNLINGFGLPKLGNSSTVILLGIEKIPLKTILKNKHLGFLLYNRTLVKIKFTHDLWMTDKETFLVVKRNELKKLHNNINKKIVISQIENKIYLFQHFK